MFNLNSFQNLQLPPSVSIPSTKPMSGLLSSIGSASAFTSVATGLIGQITNLFKGSPPSAFAEAGKTFLGTWLPQIQYANKNNPSKMFTEMSKAYNYMLLHYTAHLNGSTSDRSKTGNRMGLNYVKQFEATLSQSLSEARANYTIEKNVVNYTYPVDFYSGIKNFHGNHQGTYTQYRFTEKPDISDISQTVSRGVNKASSSANPIFIIVLLAMAFPMLAKYFKK